MARRKKCIACGQDLICVACGTAQNPPRKQPGKKFLLTGLSDEQVAMLDADAKTEGISRNELIRRRVMDKDNPHHANGLGGQ